MSLSWKPGRAAWMARRSNDTAAFRDPTAAPVTAIGNPLGPLSLGGADAARSRPPQPASAKRDAASAMKHSSRMNSPEPRSPLIAEMDAPAMALPQHPE